MLALELLSSAAEFIVNRTRSVAPETLVEGPTGEHDKSGNPIYAEFSPDEIERRVARLIAKWEAKGAEEMELRDRMVEAHAGFMAEHGERIRSLHRKPTRLEVARYMTGEYDPSDFRRDGWLIKR
jgi:hypothetical protein